MVREFLLISSIFLSVFSICCSVYAARQAHDVELVIQALLDGRRKPIDTDKTVDSSVMFRQWYRKQMGRNI